MELKPCTFKLPFSLLVAAAFLAPSFRAVATLLMCFDHISTSFTESNIGLAISTSGLSCLVRILNCSEGGLDTFVVPFPL